MEAIGRLSFTIINVRLFPACDIPAVEVIEPAMAASRVPANIWRNPKRFIKAFS